MPAAAPGEKPGEAAGVLWNVIAQIEGIKPPSGISYDWVNPINKLMEKIYAAACSELNHSGPDRSSSHTPSTFAAPTARSATQHARFLESYPCCAPKP